MIIDSQTGVRSQNSSLSVSENSLIGNSNSSTESDSRKEIAYEEGLLAKNKIIYPGMKDKEVLNSFRSLRMNLQSKMERFNSVILVSPVEQDASSSYAAINLATAFTFEHEKSALILDCHIGDSDLIKKLCVEEGAGLYDYFADNGSDIEKIIYPTMVPQLHVIPAGHPPAGIPDSLEYFGRPKIEALIADVVSLNENRVVIINAPSILGSADTKLLAGISDHVVVSVRYGRTTPIQINKIINEFGQQQITGFVMVN